MQLLTRLLGQTGRAFAPLAPDVPFAAIGDVHGCDDLLAALLARVARASPGVPVVLAGDYIDRGPDSAGVLARLSAMQQADPGGVVCLMGNHERMMLEFLETPAERGGRWLRNGGDRTLQSYGIPVEDRDPGGTELAALRDELLARIPAATLLWLASLPLSWTSGNVWVVHAGADPRVAMQMQQPQTLLWGHPDFHRTPRRDGQWVVHGHTIMHEPLCTPGRIAIDTGAFASGVLSAVAVTPEGGVRFLNSAPGAD